MLEKDTIDPETHEGSKYCSYNRLNPTLYIYSMLR